MPPLFSIITVTYNAAATLPPTLESVDGQTCQLFEHLVIDGASKDGTLGLLDAHPSPRRRVFSAPDKGIYHAMNRGLGKARGEYVIFLNAGDTFHSPDTLQRIADTAMTHDFPGVIYGQTDIVDARRRRLADRHLRAPEQLTYESFAQGMVVCHQAFVALRKLTEYFDTRYRYSADYEWCIRVLQHSRNNVMVSGVLVDYLYEGLTTLHRRESLMERFKIMARYYGGLTAVFNHLTFLPRYLRRQTQEKQFTQANRE